jgi:hypothetical protein
MREIVSRVCLIMGESHERTDYSMKIGEEREKEMKKMFLLTRNVEKVVFQQ